jgi:2-polyprenyl-3-methyl-5-hydroxy-6-metoxy-1,4-benzoquinol methylase
MIKNQRLKTNNDLYGQALLDYQIDGFTEDIKTFSTLGGEDIYPLPYLFRGFSEMPQLEQKALDLATGKILDIGCGAGSHSLYLQNNNKDVLAIDISQGAIKTCKLRGVFNTQLQDIWQLKNKQFDTILLLMNGAGMCGKLNNLTLFLNHLKTLLTPNGQILLDSTNVIYMFEDEDGDYQIDANQEYFGQTIFTMEYKNQKGEPFDWLYIDFNNLQRAAEFCKMKCELILEGNHYDYLARISH